ncbi:MAG: ATP-binding protein, partial [Pseudomonadota bacterium]|nr:ATP-binding protein [Pseudomonadota bacterium]
RAGQKYRRNAELRGSNERLQTLQQEIDTHLVDEELARTRGDIYAGVLHDINGPLTVISGFVELMNRSMHDAARVEGPELDNIKADLHQLTGQVSRCFEISRRYLSFLNASPSETKYVGVRQVLADLHDLLIKHPRAYGHELVIHDLSPDVTAEINGTDLLQILLNLTINALQSTEEPHRVEIKTRPVVSPFELEQFSDSDDQRFINRDGFLNQGPLLAITIADDGPGIQPELLKKMFEEKFTTKAPDRGTGLGLSIVKRLILEANAGIHLRTRIGEGSWFTVLLGVHEP